MSKFSKNNQKNIRFRSKKHKIKQIVFVFLFILIDLLVVFNLSDIFSSIITHQNSIFASDKIEFNSFSFYCVSLKRFQVELDAQNYGKGISKKGAMGRVYQNGEYYVFANIYPNLIEAQEIKENLMELGYDSRIVKFSIPSISLNYKGKNKTFFLDCFNFFKQTSTTLCNLSIDFDGKTISRATLNGKIAQILKEATSFMTSLSEINSKTDEQIVQVLQETFENFCAKLKENIVVEDNFATYSCQLKNTIFDLVVLLQHSFIAF